MATYKGVWFSEIHPDKWFETSKEAEDFDKSIEMANHAQLSLVGIPKGMIEQVIKALSDRYKFEQRWDWPRPTSEEILAHEQPAIAEPEEEMLVNREDLP